VGPAGTELAQRRPARLPLLVHGPHLSAQVQLFTRVVDSHGFNADPDPDLVPNPGF
jgi:hypothetical protein